ncbi:hypothetical protein V6N12_006284 [Hibiscus sabdariffa]|uniref:Uncharacterized protein n=1 Tax=Hibiscus sabdariffa TaxID=183260 RepID=A0ABR2EYC2_9ROSI
MRVWKAWKHTNREQGASLQHTYLDGVDERSQGPAFAQPLPFLVPKYCVSLHHMDMVFDDSYLVLFFDTRSSRVSGMEEMNPRQCRP